jgi:hypothetical protein
MSDPRFPVPKDFDEHMTWRIRWYLIVAITIAYALSLIGGLIGFWMTKDTHFLLFVAPTALIPFVYYLVPMDKKQYELKMAKINAKKERQETGKQIQMPENNDGTIQNP